MKTTLATFAIILLVALTGCASTSKIVPAEERITPSGTAEEPLRVYEDPSEIQTSQRSEIEPETICTRQTSQVIPETRQQASPTIISGDYVTRGDFIQYQKDIKKRLEQTNKSVTTLTKEVSYLDEEMVKLKSAFKWADLEVPVRIGNFQPGSATITKNMEKQIDKILSTLDGDSAYDIEIAGLASPDGDKITNQALAEKRANNVSKVIGLKIKNKKITILRVHGLEPGCYSYAAKNERSAMLFILKK